MTDATPVSPELQGLRILLVEDNFLIAMFLQRLLSSWGCTVVGPAPSAEEGERLARTERLNGALLDINIVGGTSVPIANVLRERELPFIFISGYGSPQGLTGFLAKVRRLSKPIDEVMLEQVILEEFVQRANVAAG